MGKKLKTCQGRLHFLSGHFIKVFYKTTTFEWSQEWSSYTGWMVWLYNGSIYHKNSFIFCIIMLKLVPAVFLCFIKLWSLKIHVKFNFIQLFGEKKIQIFLNWYPVFCISIFSLFFHVKPGLKNRVQCLWPYAKICLMYVKY